MTFKLKPALIFSTGIAVGLIGYFLIGFHCPFGFVATVMSGRITIPGIMFLPYKWVLAVAVYLMLHGLYGWLRQNEESRRGAYTLNSPALLGLLGVGVALIGFLTVYYPCPYPIDLWMLLMLEAPLGVPYGAVLILGIGLMLYAAYALARRKYIANA
jgi:hypothetical protein